MPSADARNALDEENGLLETLATEAEARAQESSGPARQILEGWVGSFRAYVDWNRKLIAGTDKSFDDQLQEEADILKTLNAAIDGYSGPVADSWRAMFREELEIIGELS